MKSVYEYYSNLPESNRPREIKTAALYITQNSIFRPNFFVNVVGKDIDMPIDRLIKSLPWMLDEWHHATLIKE